jgi:acetyl-CoA C-acetyltransferase
MSKVYIVSAKRTPIGSFGGSLASVSATDLGANAVKALLDSTGVDLGRIDEVFMGQVVQANAGQAPAKQVTIKAGLPTSVSATTVNKVCASGMKAIMLGSQSIALGENSVVIAGGMENMSSIPHYLTKARYGYGYGNGELIDGLVRDGLQNVYDGQAMGCFADATAIKYAISREEQDSFAINSYKKSTQAWEAGRFKDEVVGIEVKDRKGNIQVIDHDEEYKNVIFEKIPSLRPVFTKEGTVTAANASTINDGAAAIMLASEEKCKELGLKPLARIVAYADGEQDPAWFTTAPAIAATKALSRAGLSIQDMDFFEVNEAFAVVTLAFIKHFGISPEKVNLNGGAVSLGHPLGASGARIVGALTHILHQNSGRYGLAAICNGGGGSSSIIIERV